VSLFVLKCNEDKWDPRHLLGLNKEIPLNLEHMVSKCLAQAPKCICPHHYLFLMSALKLMFLLVQFWYAGKMKGLFFQGNSCTWCTLNDSVRRQHSHSYSVGWKHRPNSRIPNFCSCQIYIQNKTIAQVCHIYNNTPVVPGRPIAPPIIQSWEKLKRSHTLFL